MSPHCPVRDIADLGTTRLANGGTGRRLRCSAAASHTCAGALNPKPRNYTDASWQASVTDAQLRKTILLGGAAVGKSPIMPSSPDLDEKPDVVEGLVKIVRRFAN